MSNKKNIGEERTNSLQETEDGSVTVYHAAYGEAMHSRSGAWEEALLKHVCPSGLLAREGEIVVIDMGFGLGYNTLALCMELRKQQKIERCRIYAFEMDQSIETIIQEVRFNDERDRYCNDLKRLYSEGAATIGPCEIILTFGDARQTVSSLAVNNAMAVFHDPHSPGKNPELWSSDFFSLIKSRMASDGMLTTYSSAPQIRGALVEAGFHIGRGPSVGPKREGTLASPSPFAGAWSEDELATLRKNPASEPYQDHALNSDRESLLSERLQRVRARKGQG